MYYYTSIVIFLVIMIIVALYVYWRAGKWIDFFGGTKTKWWVRLLRIVCSLFIGYLCHNTWSTIGMVSLHLLAAFWLTDAVAVLMRIILGKKKESKCYYVLHCVYGWGVVPIILFAVVMGYGFYTMNHIQKTEYDVMTVKQIDDYNVALLTDIHYDTVQNPDILKEKIVQINKENPDIVILGGDIVEEGTSKEKMEEVFALLGKMENKYGIYYVYGNHDRQPYTTERTYTNEQLETAITKNGIQILEDKYVEINDEIILAGRDDAAWSGTANRATSKEIYKTLSEEERNKKFMLMIDHQPIGVEENGMEGMDLQLSGHTHAGQIWPVGILSEMTGILNYGMYHRGTCRAIVSSGVAGWRYAIRTGGQCEYVVVHIHQ